MEVAEDDPTYMAKYKDTFTKDMEERNKKKINITWLRVATALDPRFKGLKCLSRPDRAEVWCSVSALLRERQRERLAHPEQPSTSEPPKKILALMLAQESSSDEEEDRVEKWVERYKAEPIIVIEANPNQWWSTHEGAHSEMAGLAHKYLATPATSVPCERLFSLSRHIVQKKRVYLSNWLSAKK